MALPAAAPIRRRGRPSTGVRLDRAAIVGAALRLVDDEGLRALTMRRLGSRLGVEGMALYHYFPGKAALVQGLAEAALDELNLAIEVTDGGWQGYVRAAARSFRHLGVAHPEVFPFVATIGMEDPVARRSAETVLSALAGAGFDEQLALTAFAAVRSYVVGHVMWHLGPRSDGDDPGPDLRARPGLEAPDAEAHFEHGLELLVAGMEALLGDSVTDKPR
jgi:AcrR family transcriptional regulator